jgi:hypothetical protein
MNGTNKNIRDLHRTDLVNDENGDLLAYSHDILKDERILSATKHTWHQQCLAKGNS